MFSSCSVCAICRVMLIALSIRDFLLVERLDIEPGEGFTALTGETGAGKSVVLSALGGAIGAKLERAMIRKGAPSAVLTAEFAPPPDHPVWELGRENGLDLDPDEPVLFRRVIKRGGAARGWINDAPVSARLMQEIGGRLIDIHGQHAGQGLLDPARHRTLLDEYAGAQEELDACAVAWVGWRNAREAREAIEGRLSRAEAERDYLEHAVSELDKLDPQPGEADTLAADRLMLQSHEKTALAVEEAARCFDKNGPEQALASAARMLGRLGGTPVIAQLDAENGLKQSLDVAIDALERALIEAGEAHDAVQRLQSECDYAPDSLERTEERLFALRAAGRKYDADPDQLSALLDRMRMQLDEIEHSDRALIDARAAEQAAQKDYYQAADTLTAKRREAGERLSAAVKVELAPLRLNKADFRVSLAPLEETCLGPQGQDAALFEIRTNKGAEFGPLNKVASGGEMARLFLALQLCLVGAGDVETLIFDEVDVGVGGAVAAAIGDRLSRLGRERQVMAITHSPQVAASADVQWRITKDDSETEFTRTRIDILNRKDRKEEIARMLAGAEITKEARAAAGKLLARA